MVASLPCHSGRPPGRIQCTPFISHPNVPWGFRGRGHTPSGTPWHHGARLNTHTHFFMNQSPQETTRPSGTSEDLFSNPAGRALAGGRPALAWARKLRSLETCTSDLCSGPVGSISTVVPSGGCPTGRTERSEECARQFRRAAQCFCCTARRSSTGCCFSTCRPGSGGRWTLIWRRSRRRRN